MAQIETIDHLIDELGGPSEIGRWLNIGSNAVTNWSLRGEVPSGWHLRIYIELCKRGRTVNPAVFGLTDEEAAPLMHRGRMAAARPSKRLSVGAAA